MRHRVFWVILALVLVDPSTLLGQTMKPFAKFPLTKETAAQALLRGPDGDTAVLNVKASTLVDVWNQAFDLRLENRDDLVEYIRSSDVATCPTDMRLSRVRRDGTVDMKGWDRTARRGEQCLVKGGRVLVSLWCFNTTPNLYLASEDSKAIQFESPEPTPPVGAAPTTTNAQVGATKPEPESKVKPARTRRQAEHQSHERGWLYHNRGKVKVAAALVVIGVGIAVGEHNDWGRRDITQCVFVGSPGAVCPSK